jgi:hypothetical protein
MKDQESRASAVVSPVLATTPFSDGVSNAQTRNVLQEKTYLVFPNFLIQAMRMLLSEKDFLLLVVPKDTFLIFLIFLIQEVKMSMLLTRSLLHMTVQFWLDFSVSAW